MIIMKIKGICRKGKLPIAICYISAKNRHREKMPRALNFVIKTSLSDFGKVGALDSIMILSS